MHDLCSQYVTALTDNIDQRFQHSLPVISSFPTVFPTSIFDPLSVPIANPEFVGYGQNDIQTLANHSFSGVENRSQRLKLEAEWNNFKYELSDWSKDHQAIPLPSTTSTEWALLYRGSYGTKNPTVEVISCCCKLQKSASSNAWPERRASALKCLKTHLRNSLKKEMLESLLIFP